METAKPEANAYRIASAALERAETTYERLLWRQVRHEKLVESDGRSAAGLAGRPRYCRQSVQVHCCLNNVSGPLISTPRFENTLSQ